MLCKKCGATILGSGKSCVNCGAPVDVSYFRQSMKKTQSDYDPDIKEGQTKWGFNFGVISLVTSILIIGAYFAVLGIIFSSIGIFLE